MTDCMVGVALYYTLSRTQRSNVSSLTSCPELRRLHPGAGTPWI